MKHISLLISLLLITTIACSITVAAPTATDVPPTTTPEIFISLTQAMPATPVPTSSPHLKGVEVSVGPLTITLPFTVANGARGSQLPRADAQDLPYFEKTPGHTVLKLEGYTLQDKFHQPQIYVYPAAAYAEMVPAAFESIHRLDNLLYSPATPVAITKDQLPTVPFFNAAQVFVSNIQMLSFQNGGGVRFLTEYAQYAAPINNHELIYHFEGVSRDGAYYIIAILPITAPTLAETSEIGSVIPVGGFAHPDINDPNADWSGYYSNVATLLNNTAPDIFTPHLGQLDALIQSIKITP